MLLPGHAVELHYRTQTFRLTTRPTKLRQVGILVEPISDLRPMKQLLKLQHPVTLISPLVIGQALLVCPFRSRLPQARLFWLPLEQKTAVTDPVLPPRVIPAHVVPGRPNALNLNYPRA